MGVEADATDLPLRSTRGLPSRLVDEEGVTYRNNAVELGSVGLKRGITYNDSVVVPPFSELGEVLARLWSA